MTYMVWEDTKLTKKEVISNLMYELLFKESIDFEVDNESFTAYKTDKGYTIKGEHIQAQVKSKGELRQAIAKLGKEIVQL